jgi:aspartyl-tRNA(Asn)/glutamyl-tRNA(Gln) amidotransferase subunit C
MLARLGLSDEEVEMMRVQLPEVLTYIAMLERVDTSTVEPTAQIISHLNVTRADEPRPSWPVQDILGNAPASEGDFFRVPAVMEENPAGGGGPEEIDAEEAGEPEGSRG